MRFAPARHTGRVGFQKHSPHARAQWVFGSICQTHRRSGVLRFAVANATLRRSRVRYFGTKRATFVSRVAGLILVLLLLARCLAGFRIENYSFRNIWCYFSSIMGGDHHIRGTSASRVAGLVLGSASRVAGLVLGLDQTVARVAGFVFWDQPLHFCVAGRGFGIGLAALACWLASFCTETLFISWHLSGAILTQSWGQAHQETHLRRGSRVWYWVAKRSTSASRVAGLVLGLGF